MNGKPKIRMDDHWVETGEMRVVVNDGLLGRACTIAIAHDASTARRKAIRMMKKWIKQLEEMDK